MSQALLGVDDTRMSKSRRGFSSVEGGASVHRRSNHPRRCPLSTSLSPSLSSHFSLPPSLFTSLALSVLHPHLSPAVSWAEASRQASQGGSISFGYLPPWLSPGGRITVVEWGVPRLFDGSQPERALSKKNHSFLGMVEGYEARKSFSESSTWLRSAQCATEGRS